MQHRDPVCGMNVDTATAIRSSDGSSTEYFCSTACRSRFEANPDQYSAQNRAGEPLERHEPPHTTTENGITAPKFGSAGSGGAEYERLPEQHDK